MSGAWHSSRWGAWLLRFEGPHHDAMTAIAVLVLAAALAGLLLGLTSLGVSPTVNIEWRPWIP
jgi:hypothetical protein